MDGIQGIHGAYLYPPVNPHPPVLAPIDPSTKPTATDAALELNKKVFDDMQAISAIFNTRLEYRYNESLKQVIVKVIDSASDTVIKELPSAEVQAVHLRLRQALGMMVDKRA